MAGLFIALFVNKCTTCQSHRKSDFGWYRFQNSLLTCPCLRHKRIEKSQAILEHLMTFRGSISTGKPEQLLSSMCFFFSVSWSRAYGLRGLSLYTSNDLTYNSIRFKKPLDIFWPQIQRKGSEDYLVMILAVNRKLWAIFWLLLGVTVHEFMLISICQCLCHIMLMLMFPAIQ